jgi:hypothetical protein
MVGVKKNLTKKDLDFVRKIIELRESEK